MILNLTEADLERERQWEMQRYASLLKTIAKMDTVDERRAFFRGWEIQHGKASTERLKSDFLDVWNQRRAA